MKKGVLHTLIVIGILLLSVGCGVLSDTVMTKYEYKKYPLPSSVGDSVSDLAKEYGIPATLICAVVKTQSGFDASKSQDGRVGLMQISEEEFNATLPYLPTGTTKDPAVLYDPQLNLRCGICRLHRLFLTYGNYDTALIAYLAGEAKTDAWLSDSDLTDEYGNITEIPDDTVKKQVAAVQKTQAVYLRLYPEL